MADEGAACRAEGRLCKIEEDEVETKPDLLVGSSAILLDPGIQQGAKEFFSEDAWECVQSTLKVLEGY